MKRSTISRVGLVVLGLIGSLRASAEYQGCDAKLHGYVQSRARLGNYIRGAEVLTIVPPVVLFATESLKQLSRVPAPVRRAAQFLTSETAFRWAGVPLAISFIAFASDLDQLAEVDDIYLLLHGSMVTAGSAREREYHSWFAHNLNSMYFGRVSKFLGLYEGVRTLLNDQPISGEELAAYLRQLRASQAMCKGSGELRSARLLYHEITHGLAAYRGNRTADGSDFGAAAH